VVARHSEVIKGHLRAPVANTDSYTSDVPDRLEKNFPAGAWLLIRREVDFTIKRTYQPKKRYRRRVHGFMKRMSTVGGARVIQNRRRKGRSRLGAS
jgi:large subunit ribosomal protein L34